MINDYNKYINQQVLNLRPSGIRRFFDLVSEMPDIISLGVGEPDFATPWFARDYAIKTIQKGYTQYTSNLGMAQLREEIAYYLVRRFDLEFEPSQILVTVGASQAIDLALRTLVTTGDEVLIPEPSYVSYAPNVELVGGVPVPVPTTAEDSFRLTAKALEQCITPRTRVLVLSYPNNPTGAIMQQEHLEQVARLAVEHDLMVISDEIYAELTYEGTFCSVAKCQDMAERTMVINGFSKAFAMTGWRIGYVAAPQPLIDAVKKIHQYTIMCAPTMSQAAALAALRVCREDNYVAIAEMRDEYDARRRYLVDSFNEMGLTCFEPKGAFYVFPSVARTGLDGEKFAQGLLAHRVAVVPGQAFGDAGRNHVRASYACSMRNLVTAVKRIGEYVSELID